MRVLALDGDFCFAVASKIKHLRAVAGKHLHPLAAQLSQNCPSRCQHLHGTASQFWVRASSCVGASVHGNSQLQPYPGGRHPRRTNTRCAREIEALTRRGLSAPKQCKL